MEIISNGQTLNLRMNLTFNKIEKVKICTVINRSNMHIISHIWHILYILFILQTLHILHIFHACHIMHVVHKVWLSILFSKGQVSKRSSFIPWVTDMGRLWSDLGPIKRPLNCCISTFEELQSRNRSLPFADKVCFSYFNSIFFITLLNEKFYLTNYLEEVVVLPV